MIACRDLPDSAREVAVEVSDTKNSDHGDFTCNFALTASKRAGMAPRALAQKLKEALDLKSGFLKSVEVAGPGFLNFRILPAAVAGCVREILESGPKFGRSPQRDGTKINVEFVSVNPNGPITIGSGRGAAFGDALCRVLDAAGFRAFREYYINDGVNSQQMKLFAESVKFYYRTALGFEGQFPDGGYRGSYVSDLANELVHTEGASAQDPPVSWFQEQSQKLMIRRQEEDLIAFRVRFDRWSSEQDLHTAGKVNRALAELEANGNAYRATQSQPTVFGTDARQDPEEAGEDSNSGGIGQALWLRSTDFGDDKDRVLIRADGRPAYIAADVAYLSDKFERGFEKLKLILGPDHHGYINRLYAACQASGHTTGREGEFEIIIYQVVRFVKDGKPAVMRKRDGNIYELRDLIEELGKNAASVALPEEQARIGADVARFFFLMRNHETHMDFDIDLATKQSDENPVFYAQYAHARICSVIARAKESSLDADPNFLPALLTDRTEIDLIKKILDLPFEIERIALDYGVHRLTTFAVELGRAFHHFYDACRVVQTDQPELSKARLALCDAARIALHNTFELLGVSAPERMERQREMVEPVS
jgi:arginyl-tRNA synthetase